jgi:hypothetical protein
MALLTAALVLTGCASTSTEHPVQQNEERMRQARIDALAAGSTKVRAEFRQAYIDGRVVVGMTAQEAFGAWGRPSAANRTTVHDGARVQYVYRSPGRSNRYFYTVEGVVVGIQGQD